MRQTGTYRVAPPVCDIPKCRKALSGPRRFGVINMCPDCEREAAEAAHRATGMTYRPRPEQRR